MNKNSLHIQNDSGKAKKKCEFIKNLEFSVEIFDIICGSLATQHARWHKSITLRGGQAVPTSHITLREEQAAPASHITLRGGQAVRTSHLYL